jgi:hypothetical protein
LLLPVPSSFAAAAAGAMFPRRVMCMIIPYPKRQQEHFFCNDPRMNKIWVDAWCCVARVRLADGIVVIF